MRKPFVLLFVTILCGVLAVGCDDLVSDPNFHTWCGDQLCSWKLESGQIRRAPTWHKKDYGVELMDSTDATHKTVLSQETDNTPHCLEFSTIADVAPEAQVSIGLDFDRDGTIDWEQPVAAAGFREQKTQMTAPLHYDGIRFVITKKGTGRAVLAQMQVKGVKGCTAAPLERKQQALGASCSLALNGDDCSSGTCCDGLCSECCLSSSRIERQQTDGTYAKNREVACPTGVECKARFDGIRGFLEPSVPAQCEGGNGKRTAGTECLLGDDCTSGVCEGTLWSAVSGPNGENPCTLPPPYTEHECNVVFVRGGRCQ